MVHYLKGMAVADIASAIPFEVIVSSATAGEDGSHLGTLRVLRVLRLTKMLRVMRSAKVLRRVEESWHVHYSCARNTLRERL